MRLKFPSRDLFFARTYYFTYMGGWGFVLPFINLFYVGLGLSGTQIGTISSTNSIVSLIFAPIIVNEMKKRPQARSLLQISILLGAWGYYLLGQQTAYIPILAIVFFQALVGSVILPVSDSMAVAVSKSTGSGYGGIRVFGSLGWIVTVLASGWLIEKYDFGAGFLGISLAWVLAAGLVFFIHKSFFVTPPNADLPKSNLWGTIQRVVSDRTLLGFAVALIFIGFLNSGVLQFENVFLAELGASKRLIAVAGILSAVVELPFMLYADRFIRRHGPSLIMFIALVMIMLQRTAVFLLPSIATIMLARLIGGVSFSFYTVSFVSLISSRTDQSETGTVLALYTITLASLVNILAAPTAGILFDAVGARWLYALAGAGYALGALCIWLTRPTGAMVKAE
jgi:PPP family 3-phenylpropionic acid transporter